jgi:hypothetical protein
MKAFVNIVSDGATGVGAKITQEDGTEIKGVRSAVITLDIKKVSTADLELIGAGFIGKAQPCFHIKHPITAELKKVSRIEFADGSVFDGE